MSADTVVHSPKCEQRNELNQTRTALMRDRQRFLETYNGDKTTRNKVQISPETIRVKYSTINRGIHESPQRRYNHANPSREDRKPKPSACRECKKH